MDRKYQQLPHLIRLALNRIGALSVLAMATFPVSNIHFHEWVPSNWRSCCPCNILIPLSQILNRWKYEREQL